jgi:hypothetical protein
MQIRSRLRVCARVRPRFGDVHSEKVKSGLIIFFEVLLAYPEILRMELTNRCTCSRNKGPTVFLAAREAEKLGVKSLTLVKLHTREACLHLSLVSAKLCLHEIFVEVLTEYQNWQLFMITEQENPDDSLPAPWSDKCKNGSGLRGKTPLTNGLRMSP